MNYIIVFFEFNNTINMAINVFNNFSTSCNCCTIFYHFQSTVFINLVNFFWNKYNLTRFCNNLVIINFNINVSDFTRRWNRTIIINKFRDNHTVFNCCINRSFNDIFFTSWINCPKLFFFSLFKWSIFWLQRSNYNCQFFTLNNFLNLLAIKFSFFNN